MENVCPNGQSSSKWQLVCQEILSTEHTYAKFLKVLLEEFKPSIEAVLGKQSSIIFANVEQLYEFSLQFVVDLQAVLESNAAKQGKPRVGELYKRVGPYYAMYSEYCRNHSDAMDFITKLSGTNPDFCAVVKECETQSEQSLLSLLIMPIQRVPRHVLLLRELVSTSTPGDPDYEACKEGLKLMMGIAAKLNETVLLKENAVRVWEIQNSLVFLNDDECAQQVNLFEQNRRFVKEGTLLKVCGRKHKKKRRLILFNDCLVYARSTNVLSHRRRWVFRAKLHLRRVQVLEEHSSLALGAKFAFVVQCKERTLVCIASSEEERLEWVHELSTFCPPKELLVSQETSSHNEDISSEGVSSEDEDKDPIGDLTDDTDQVSSSSVPGKIEVAAKIAHVKEQVQGSLSAVEDTWELCGKLRVIFSVLLRACATQLVQDCVTAYRFWQNRPWQRDYKSFARRQLPVLLRSVAKESWSFIREGELEQLVAWIRLFLVVVWSRIKLQSVLARIEFESLRNHLRRPPESSTACTNPLTCN